MKSRLSIASIAIEKGYIDALQRASRQENRSLSKLIESILAKWLGERNFSEQIPTTSSRFVGRFSREDTYADD
jgi:hypothetical protein